jgi:hypothetical protein
MKIKLTHQQIFTYAIQHIVDKGFKIEGQFPSGEAEVTVEGHRLASNSFGNPFDCKHEWPLDCLVQCGGDGMVITDKTASMEDALTDPAVAAEVVSGEVEHRRTAFFEAFPKNPKTFLRGEGGTIEEAEDKCWKHYQKILSCTTHEFERRNRIDGYCFCKHCGLSGMFMDPLHPCTGCGATSYKQYSTDKHDKPYCEQCYRKLPNDMLNESTLRLQNLLKGIR